MKAIITKVETVFGWNTAIFTFKDEKGNTYIWETTSEKAFDELHMAHLYNKVVELKSFKSFEGTKQIKNVRYNVVNA